MITIEKNKQFLTVKKTVKSRNETTCIGIFDINKGYWCEEAPFVKQSMKGQSYTDLLRLLVRADEERLGGWNMYKERIQFMDFCSSVLETNINDLVYIATMFSNHEFEKINDNLKKAKKAISKNKEEIKANPNALSTLIFREIYSVDGELGKEDFIQEIYGYYKMGCKARSFSFQEEQNFRRDYIDTILEYKKRGYSNNNIMTAFRIYYFQGANVCFDLGTIFRYIDKVNELEIDMPTGNFLINYRQVCLAYEDKRNEIESKKFERQQTEKALKFEKDNITMVVPTTREELKHYGNVFGNCLNGWEWDNQLSNGRRYVVIILKDGIPEVSCDIDRQTMLISQYYTHNNKLVRDTELIDFRKEYQIYLHSLIKE